MALSTQPKFNKAKVSYLCSQLSCTRRVRDFLKLYLVLLPFWRRVPLWFVEPFHCLTVLRHGRRSSHLFTIVTYSIACKAKEGVGLMNRYASIARLLFRGKMLASLEGVNGGSFTIPISNRQQSETRRGQYFDKSSWRSANFFFWELLG